MQLVSLVMILSLPVSAPGYIPSAHFIIKMMLRGNQAVHDVEVEQTATLFDEYSGEDGLQAPSKLYIKFSGSFRLDTTLPFEREILLHSDGLTLTVMNGGIVSEVPDIRCILKDFLVERSPDNILEVLHANHINTDRMGLGRFNGKIAYIIGANEGQTQAPQLWLDKDTFLPVRFIKEEEKEDGPSILEVRYLNYKYIDRKYRYPSVVEFYRDNKLTLRYQTRKVVVNTSIPNNLFDIQKITEK